MTARRLGWRPDPPGHPGTPTKRFAARSGAIALRGSLASLVVDVRDQGQLGSCVAVSGVQALRMREIAQGVPTASVVLGSALYGYFYGRAEDGMASLAYDAGTTHASFFQGMSEYGLAPESIWPYSDLDTGAGSDPFRRFPPAEAVRLGFDQRAVVAQAIDDPDPRVRLDAVRSAISELRPVLLGCDVDKAFETGDFDPTKPLDPPTVSAGGHAMIVEAYDGDIFTILNSWGEDFGTNGRILFSSAYLATCALRLVERTPIIEGEAT